MKSITAHSSHGSITFDASTGVVTEQQRTCNCKAKDHCTLANPITKVDVKEHLDFWQQKEFTGDVDILDISYFRNVGSRERPVEIYIKAESEWREECKNYLIEQSIDQP